MLAIYKRVGVPYLAVIWIFQDCVGRNLQVQLEHN